MEGSMSEDKKKNWTVMVFMGAATIEGEEDLLDAAEDDLLEMATVGSGPVQTINDGELNRKDPIGNLNIFVQVYARERSGKNRKTCARFGKIEPKMFDHVKKEQV